MSDTAIAEMSGTAALPRENGELVFAEPWEGRAFGIAVALNEAGTYNWEEFRRRLIGQIEVAETDDGTHYYERWLASLENLLLEGGVISPEELAAREQEIVAHDEHEHDHDHDHHDHGHDHEHPKREVAI